MDPNTAVAVWLDLAEGERGLTRLPHRCCTVDLGTRVRHGDGLAGSRGIIAYSACTLAHRPDVYAMRLETRRGHRQSAATHPHQQVKPPLTLAPPQMNLKRRRLCSGTSVESRLGLYRLMCTWVAATQPTRSSDHPPPMATTRLQPMRAEEHPGVLERRIWPVRPR